MTQVREEIYFTKGRVIVRGKMVKRGEAKKADYLLFYKPGIPLAVVEAKDNNHVVGAGLQQALEYAEILDVPFAYSSNGDAFLEHDRTGTGETVEIEIPLDQFPSPPTTHVWYYEHPYPPGAKSYNKGKPIRIEEFEGERAWWGKPDKSGAYSKRVENEQAWRVSIDQIKAGNFNLDLKNPHNPDTGPGDVDHLLPEYEKLLDGIARTRAALKRELALALGANGKEKE